MKNKQININKIHSCMIHELYEKLRFVRLLPRPSFIGIE